MKYEVCPISPPKLGTSLEEYSVYIQCYDLYCMKIEAIKLAVKQKLQIRDQKVRYNKAVAQAAATVKNQPKPGDAARKEKQKKSRAKARNSRKKLARKLRKLNKQKAELRAVAEVEELKRKLSKKSSPAKVDDKKVVPSSKDKKTGPNPHRPEYPKTEIMNDPEKTFPRLGANKEKNRAARRAHLQRERPAPVQSSKKAQAAVPSVPPRPPPQHVAYQAHVSSEVQGWVASPPHPGIYQPPRDANGFLLEVPGESAAQQQARQMTNRQLLQHQRSLQSRREASVVDTDVGTMYGSYYNQHPQQGP